MSEDEEADVIYIVRQLWRERGMRQIINNMFLREERVFDVKIRRFWKRILGAPPRQFGTFLLWHHWNGFNVTRAIFLWYQGYRLTSIR